MKFAIVAEYFEKLEATSKRLEMFEILSDLFNKTPDEDIDKLIYIAQERIKPAFEGVEIGMADRMLEKAIARATGTDIKKVKELHKKKGDLGLVAEELSGRHGSKLVKPKELTLAEVYEGFLETAQVSGDGSVDKKVAVISGLLSRAGPKEAKYISRFVIGRLRLGIGDPTIIDSLAKAKTGERKLRPELERAYNLCSDLGLVAKLFFTKGMKGIEKFEVTPGKPIRMALAERLPSPKEIIEKIGKASIESKYDGFRCISGLTSIYIRDRGFLPAKDVKVGDLVLTHRGNFRKVEQKFKRKIAKEERMFRLQTYLGDEFNITEKHKILCHRGNKMIWLPVEDMIKDNLLVFPIPSIRAKVIPNKLVLETHSCYKKSITLDKNFYRFLGFWIGDGYSNNQNKTSRVGLIFNAKTERNLCEYYQQIIENTLKEEHIHENLHNGAIYLYWDDKPLLEWLSRNFRCKWKEDWRGKNLPDWFFGISKENFNEFMKGWFEADGTIDNQNRASITTKEANLAVMAQLIGLKFKRIFGIKKIRIKGSTYYKIVITKSKRKAWIRGNHVLVKIYRLDELRRRHPRGVDPRQRVYNFEVQGDQSYCTGMVALHNCQVHKIGDTVQIFSRNLENTTSMFPDIVESIKKYVKAKDAIIEGEALVYNEDTGELMPFQVTMTRKRKYEIEAKKKELPLKLFVFDLLYADNKDYTQEPYSERIKAIEKYVKTGEALEYADRIITDDPKVIQKFFDKSISAGLEGVMAKRLDAPYSAGARNFNWIKLKRSYRGELSDTIDIVIVGYLKGRGMRTVFGIGAILGAVYDEKEDVFKTIAKVGSGFSEENWVKLRKELDKISVKHKPARVDSLIIPDVWVEPRYVITVRADEITKSPLHTAGKHGDEPGYALRFPRATSYIRTDKKAEDANSVKEIEEMFKQQKHVGSKAGES